mmetsp:Transcript_31296/g.72383  ORF Transcript_31296/g.72383 Transcript_31296/m.72383 type:complete len:236 (+) Transcript_31296:2597-3304(+)
MNSLPLPWRACAFAWVEVIYVCQWKAVRFDEPSPAKVLLSRCAANSHRLCDLQTLQMPHQRWTTPWLNGWVLRTLHLLKTEVTIHLMQVMMAPNRHSYGLASACLRRTQKPPTPPPRKMPRRQPVKYAPCPCLGPGTCSKLCSFSKTSRPSRAPEEVGTHLRKMSCCASWSHCRRFHWTAGAWGTSSRWISQAHPGSRQRQKVRLAQQPGELPAAMKLWLCGAERSGVGHFLPES